jgi:hypothetical protein
VLWISLMDIDSNVWLLYRVGDPDPAGISAIKLAHPYYYGSLVLLFAHGEEGALS